MARTIKRYLSTDDSKGETPVVGIESEEFGKRLWRILNDKNMSQTALAKLVWNEKRVDKNLYESWKGRDLISSYVRGKSQPSPQVLSRIAKALHVTPEELMPSVAAKIVDKEPAALQINMAPGRSDLCHLRVNKLVSLQTALKIGQLIDADEAK